MTTRAKVIGKVHLLAKQLGFDEDTYRTALLAHTGRTSCKEMTDAQLGRLAEALDFLAKGKLMPGPAALPANRHKDIGTGQAVPTTKQWEVLEGLARRAGWSGLQDFRLLAFARHTTKVADLGEMSRSGMSKLIIGLNRRLSQLNNEVTK